MDVWIWTPKPLNNIVKNINATTSKCAISVTIKIASHLMHCTPQFRSGIHFTTFTCEPTYFLPYLYKRISSAGGKLIRKRIESFDELHMFDVVINCAGLGAKVLVKDDVALIPIRGQVMRVKAPWVKAAVIDDSDDGNYIIPK